MTARGPVTARGPHRPRTVHSWPRPTASLVGALRGVGQARSHATGTGPARGSPWVGHGRSRFDAAARRQRPAVGCRRRRPRDPVLRRAGVRRRARRARSPERRGASRARVLRRADGQALEQRARRSRRLTRDPPPRGRRRTGRRGRPGGRHPPRSHSRAAPRRTTGADPGRVHRRPGAPSRGRGSGGG